MSLSNLIVGVTALTALITTLAMITIACLVVDINNFYDDSMAELSEFKVCISEASSLKAPC